MIFKKEQLIKKLKMGFPWGPAVKTALSAQRGWVLSLLGELDPTCDIVQPENKKQKTEHNLNIQ